MSACPCGSTTFSGDEWMMGWPDGWVTDVSGVSRNDALKICGNGVVPQQAIAGLTFLLGDGARSLDGVA